MSKPLPMRPHHGLCIKHFIGKGYSPDFVKNMTAVIKELNNNPYKEIILQCKTDVICFACPHNFSSVCETDKKVAGYDKRCLKLCGLSEGVVLNWITFQNFITKKILLPGRLSEVCGDCKWNSICNNIKAE